MSISYSQVKRVLLVGYYGMSNTGDDALLAVSAWGLNKVFPCSVKIYATTDRAPRFAGGRPAIPIHGMPRIVPRQRTIVESAAAAMSNAVVFGGGSVLHSVSQIRRKISLLKLSGKGPHAGIGVSLGPFENGKAERLCGELLQRLNFLGVRDQESFDIAKSLAPGLPCKITLDLAPLMPAASNIPRSELASKNTRRGIGIALCPYERFAAGDRNTEHLRKEKIVQVIRQLEPADAEEIVFIDFNGHPVKGDSSFHREIIARLGNRHRVRHVNYLSDPLAVLEEVSKLRVIIAMRLHAAVFAYIAGTPAIMLSYHPKCDGWAGRIGIDKKYVLDSANFNVMELLGLVDNALCGDYEFPAMPFPEAESLSMENFVWPENTLESCLTR